MAVAAVTGAASGIGAALRRRLEADGWRVVGVDLSGTDVNADLSTPEGRAAAAAGVRAAAGGRLDAVAACAGVRPENVACVRVNYFGAVGLLEALRADLAAAPAPAAVAISSYALISTEVQDPPTMAACLAGDEPAAVAAAAAAEAGTGYASSKLALARWVRREAVSAGWAGAGITLNAIAPGLVTTPMTERLLSTPERVSHMFELVPMAHGRLIEPEEIAGAAAFLLGPDARSILGQVLFVDGGAEAVLRPDHPI